MAKPDKKRFVQSLFERRLRGSLRGLRQAEAFLGQAKIDAFNDGQHTNYSMIVDLEAESRSLIRKMEALVPNHGNAR